MKTTTNPGATASTVAQSMEPGLRAMAQRMDQAEDNFLDMLCDLGGIERDAARVVLANYRKHKLVKRDAVGGRITVKHGALLDREIIRRAVG